MLQAFALDNVLCSTGFFTNRYTVADIGPYLQVRSAPEQIFFNSCTNNFPLSRISSEQ